MHKISRELTIATFLLAVAMLGCGKPAMRDGFAEAYGTVTLDGQPLAGAHVTFENEKGTSFARTDSSGNYETEYSRTLKGAALGKHRISISTAVGSPDQDPSTLTRNPKTGEYEAPELVPAKYRKDAQIEIDVTADGAPYNFELTSN
ncbi:carboxypeptidase-like regulatory domain-containing protein [Lacipirellula sp.]|uniref:carboxypeptidase-like regulatory domain-containing protein n=1 Tax=Lacipirellula sp. TaxID=2691419 RepID=UPI003D1525DE